MTRQSAQSADIPAMNLTPKQRIFLIGTGGIVGRHATALKQVAGAVIAGVCDLDQARAQRFVEQNAL